MEPIEMRDGIPGAQNRELVRSPNELVLEFGIENGQHEVKQHYRIYDSNR